MRETALLQRLLGWLRRLAGRGAVLVSAGASSALRRLRSSALWSAAVRPFQVAAAALLGIGYGPLVLTAVGALVALAAGLVKARPPLAELETPILLGAGLLVPTIGYSVAAFAMGTGAIVGVACALTGYGLWIGLEWAVVGALGAGIGVLLISAPTPVLIACTLGGGLVGGSVGLLTWLCCTQRAHGHLSSHWAARAGTALALAALYTAWTVSASLTALVAPPAP